MAVRSNHPPERKGKAPSPKAAALSAADAALLSDLKRLRTSLAQKSGVPPFVVFSDATLEEMALSRPRNEAALLTITGVGEVKRGRYGKAFLEVIAQHAKD